MFLHVRDHSARAEEGPRGRCTIDRPDPPDNEKPRVPRRNVHVRRDDATLRYIVCFVCTQITAALVENEGCKSVTKLNDRDDRAAETRTTHAGNIDLEQFERRDRAEGLYVLHRDLGEWYFSFREPRIVVSRQVHTGSL